MPFALVVIGLICVITGARNTYKDFGAALVNDFTGPGNFTWWLVAIGSIGALGYIDGLRSFSRMFMALIIVSMVLKNGGVFDKVKDALNQGPIAPTATASVTPGSASASNSTSDTISTIANIAKTAAILF